MRRAGRVDSNQATIVDVLRFVGATVAITSGAGHGLPDLLVGWRGKTFMIEVKDGRRKLSARRLTRDEQWFVDHWVGHPVAIVESETETLRAIGFSEDAARFAFAEFLRPRPRRAAGAPRG